MSLKDVLLDELRDLYSAENQLVKALPKTIRAVSDSRMKELLRGHLEETKGQVLRLRDIFKIVGEKATGKHCNGMEGCIAEVTEALGEDEEGALKDAGILGASLRVEHYEVAGYTAAIAMAKVLGEKEIVSLLKESLNQETSTAKNIVSAAGSILKEANSQEEDEEDEAENDESAEEEKSEKQSEEDEEEAAPELNNVGASKLKKKK